MQVHNSYNTAEVDIRLMARVGISTKDECLQSMLFSMALGAPKAALGCNVFS